MFYLNSMFQRKTTFEEICNKAYMLKLRSSLITIQGTEVREHF